MSPVAASLGVGIDIAFAIDFLKSVNKSIFLWNCEALILPGFPNHDYGNEYDHDSRSADNDNGIAGSPACLK